MQFYLCLYSLGHLLTKTKISWSDSLVVLMPSMMSWVEKWWLETRTFSPLYLSRRPKKKKNLPLLGTVFVID